MSWVMHEGFSISLRLYLLFSVLVESAMLYLEALAFTFHNTFLKVERAV